MNDRKDKSPHCRPDISRTYAHEEARGLVFFGDAYYGPSFKVAHPRRGQLFGVSSTLFHFSESSGLNCLQIALDHPGAETRLWRFTFASTPTGESRRSRNSVSVKHVVTRRPCSRSALRISHLLGAAHLHEWAESPSLH